jgi:3-hydroxyisobutyrate dehydrogenase
MVVARARGRNGPATNDAFCPATGGRSVSSDGVFACLMAVRSDICKHVSHVEGGFMAAQPEAVAVLGVGSMGHGMAMSALRAGIPTVVWNRASDATNVLAELGADVAPTAGEAAAAAGIVVTMVTNADAVVSVAIDQGMLRALRPGAIWAQMSTIGVTGTEQIATLLERERSDVALVDAPVSGSKEPAEQGNLTIFASGPDDARSRVTPLFDALGQRTVWVGPVGAGSRLKLVNNTLLAFTAEGLASSIAVAHRLGLETATVIDALDGGPLMSPWESAKLQRIVNDDYSPQFALALALKDVRLALEEVDPKQFDAYGSLAREWERAAERGFGDQDVTAVTRALEESGGSS